MGENKVKDTELLTLKCIDYVLGVVFLVLLVLVIIKAKHRDDAISNMRKNVITVKIEESGNPTSQLMFDNQTGTVDLLAIIHS